MKSKTTTIKCGTCEYWTGNRVPVFGKNGEPRVDIVDRNGDCLNINSRFCDKKREQNAQCKHFSKWTELF